MAYVRVSTLGGAVNKSRVMEDVERIKEMFWTVTQFSIEEEEEEDEEVMQTALQLELCSAKETFN